MTKQSWKLKCPFLYLKRHPWYCHQFISNYCVRITRIPNTTFSTTLQRSVLVCRSVVCIKVDIYQNSGNRTCRLNNTLLGQVKAVVPDANLVVAEQTFSWMSKFKKTLNSMPKRHQLFMLHRLVRGRNSYTEY